MDFEGLLIRARAGDEAAGEEIYRMYRPLLINSSIVDGVFDEDLYQELSAVVVRCIKGFKV